MPRITDKERSRMHNYLDSCIDKMNSPKNSKKCHWSKEKIESLAKRVLIEAHELELAVMEEDRESVYDECKDVINLAMMIIDNLFLC